jgi:hypothetical protein
VIGIDVPDPLEQVHAARASIIPDEVNRGVFPPYDSVGFIAEIPREAQRIAIELRRGLDIRDV